jgi:short-subunit dehydrogenase
MGSISWTVQDRLKQSRGVFVIVVTGATGNIGAELVRRLAASGEKVRGLTRNAARARFPEGT